METSVNLVNPVIKHLVNIHHLDDPENVYRTYAVIDEQSNPSNESSSGFLNFFGVKGPVIQYEQRRTTRFIISSLNGKSSIRLPPLIECDNIPNNLDDIPISEVARSYKHMRDIEEVSEPTFCRTKTFMK